MCFASAKIRSQTANKRKLQIVKISKKKLRSLTGVFVAKPSSTEDG